MERMEISLDRDSMKLDLLAVLGFFKSAILAHLKSQSELRVQMLANARPHFEDPGHPEAAGKFPRQNGS